MKTYTGHEQAEHTTECETHTTCHHGLHRTRLHGGLHLYIPRLASCLSGEQIPRSFDNTNRLDHHLLLFTHPRHGSAPGSAHARGRGHSRKTHGDVRTEVFVFFRFPLVGVDSNWRSVLFGEIRKKIKESFLGEKNAKRNQDGKLAKHSAKE